MGEPDMQVSSDSSVKSETNTQHRRRSTGALTKGQSEACSVAPWVPSVWVLLGAGAGLSSVGWGFGVPGGESCFTLSLPRLCLLLTVSQVGDWAQACGSHFKV